MTTPSKAEKIRRLLRAGKLSNKEIAYRTDSADYYVRTVRQRMEGRDPNKKYTAKVAAHADREAARASRRAAYKKARKAGVEVRKAESVAAMAYKKSLYRTGRISLRKQQAAEVSP